MLMIISMFYRFISENFASYIEAGDDSIHYAKLSDRVITDDIKDDAIKTKGYFIYPSQFIDASGLFKKEINTNTLTDDHIDKIMGVFDRKENLDHFARSVPLEEIAANDYNLSVSSYVEAKDTREITDITALNAELKTTVAKIDRLRAEIDAIVAEIEA